VYICAWNLYYFHFMNRFTCACMWIEVDTFWGILKLFSQVLDLRDFWDIYNVIKVTVMLIVVILDIYNRFKLGNWLKFAIFTFKLFLSVFSDLARGWIGENSLGKMAQTEKLFKNARIFHLQFFYLQHPPSKILTTPMSLLKPEDLLGMI